MLQTFANNDRRFLDPQKLCRTWTPRLKIPTLRKRIPPFIRDVTGRGTLQFTMHTPCPCKAGGAPSGPPLLCPHARVLTLLPSAAGVGGWVGVGGSERLMQSSQLGVGGLVPSSPHHSRLLPTAFHLPVSYK